MLGCGYYHAVRFGTVWLNNLIWNKLGMQIMVENRFGLRVLYFCDFCNFGKGIKLYTF